MDSPESLFSKVFKSRYFRNADPLENIRSYSPSYAWKSIITARSLVKKRLIKRVGTGSSISVWNDTWIPAPRPRSATCKFLVYPDTFKVKDLIDTQTNTWNMPLLEATIIPEDVNIIQSIAVSRFGRSDSNGWHFTKNGKYSVKSGYKIETLYPDKDIDEVIYGPTITSLQASVWELKCPPKIQHFIWQAVTWCVCVPTNLRTRGIKSDILCGVCGAEEETINHVLFECPPAIQTWALSKIPSHPDIFPKSSIYTNLDYLFNHISKDDPKGYFPWIIWYLWKSRNDKVYKNITRKPPDILMLVESEGKVWEEAQEIDISHNSHIGLRMEPIQPDRWRCQVDGTWKEKDKFSGQGWVCEKSGTEDMLIGARNIRSNQFPLHAELEALIWAMECMQSYQRLKVDFITDCSDVVKIVSSPEEWPAFAIHWDEISRCISKLETTKIIYSPRTTNIRADNLARSARSLKREMVYVNSDPPKWLTKAF